MGNNIILAKSAIHICIQGSFAGKIPSQTTTKATLLPKDKHGKIIGKNVKKIFTCIINYIETGFLSKIVVLITSYDQETRFLIISTCTVFCTELYKQKIDSPVANSTLVQSVYIPVEF
ncbi:hypothetical protein RIVM261_056450 [Rivularia sp. IAM M-261]|nr:hypothetical protein RIVM261_056450 [Rivularia sp. IAM M-261]